jgi:hypothetical protein
MLKQFSIKKINLKINDNYEYTLFLQDKNVKICYTLKNVFKHEVCTLKEIIESEREKYKKQSELRILRQL